MRTKLENNTNEFVTDEMTTYKGFTIHHYSEDTPGLPSYSELTVSKDGKTYRVPTGINGYGPTIGSAKLFIDDVINGIVDINKFEERKRLYHK